MRINPRLKVFVRLDGNNNPVPLSEIRRKFAPRNGTWIDLSACAGCCNQITSILTVDNPQTLNINTILPPSFNLTTIFSVNSTTSDVLTYAILSSNTSDTITVNFNTNGIFTISLGDSLNPHTGTFLFTVSDTHGNTLPLNLAIVFTP